MEPAKAVKEYKEQIKELEKKVDKYAKTVGKLTVERDCPRTSSCGVVVTSFLRRAVGKEDSPQKSNNLLGTPSKSLDLSTLVKQSGHEVMTLCERRAMMQVQTDNDIDIASSRKHELLGISRSYNYYTSVINKTKEAIKRRIIEIAEDEFVGIYGEEKVYRQLLEEGYRVSLNTVSKYRRELGIKAILAVKPASTTVSDESHPKYSYKLKDIEIDRPNKVWSTDITYITKGNLSQ